MDTGGAERYFIGLDSGGTKTECWLGSATEVLARAAGGTCKLTRVGQAVATERLLGLLEQVSRESGVALADVTHTCVGVAGYSIADVRAWARQVVGGAVGGSVEVVGDDEIALDAAFRGGPGILLIGGTGSAVLGRAATGERFTCGGWGPAVGDEGSGFWIGQQAVRRALQGLDRGGETGLLQALCDAWGVPDAGALVALGNARPGPDFASLVRTVAARAGGGDLTAVRLLEEAGELLAEQVTVVWQRLSAFSAQAVPVAFTGSVVEKIGTVRQRMIACLPAGLPVVCTAVNSMEGAMWRARRFGVGE